MVDFFQYYILLVVMGLGLAAMEYLSPAYKTKIIRKQTFNDIFYGLFTFVVITPFAGFVIIKAKHMGFHLYFPVHVFDEQIRVLPFSIQVVIGVLLIDLSIFIRHWVMHKYLWNVHATHHSAKEVTWLTKYRAHPIELILAVFVSACVLYVFGFSGEAIAVAHLIIAVFDLVNHTNINFGLPKPLCYLISTPNYHRWHHALEKKAIDKNLSVACPLIDIIFGTYYYPKELPKKCGMFFLENDSLQEYPENLLKQLLYPFKKL